MQKKNLIFPCKQKTLSYGVVPACSIMFFLLFNFSASGQMRKFGLIYSDNLKGGTTLFGNTLLCLKEVTSDGTESVADTTIINSNRYDGNSNYGNDYNYMGNVDVDGNQGEGSTTRNSSSADLILPSGKNTIKLARIYWGGRVAQEDFNMELLENQKIKLRKGVTGKYTDLSALHIDKAEIIEGYTEYQAYADITDFITKNGSGTYTAGNAALSTGAIANGGNNGGWCILVVYENPAFYYNSVRVYDGFEKVFNDGSPATTSVTLTGLDVPSGALNAGDAKMGVMAWEGDANLSGDFLKINGNYFSNQTNQYYNPWNGTITNNGAHVITKNPDFTNQMGIDIDMFDAGTYGIEPNATSVSLEFGTEADQYYPGLFSFSIRMKDPTITLEKTVEDANKNQTAEADEILTYTLKGNNSGTGNANNIIIIDTLPNTVTYISNTLKIISAPGVTAGSKTDIANDDVAEFIADGIYQTVIFRIGSGANATKGGSIGSGETYQVQFQVRVNAPATGQKVPSIMNIARIKSNSDANIIFVDDATAILNSQQAAMPVTLEKLTAQSFNNEVAVNWTTSMEINCKEFVIERSYDGREFSTIGKTNGNGTSSAYHTYLFTDDAADFSNSVIFYRLKQIDLDGKTRISKTVAVKILREANSFFIYPNPFTGYVNIRSLWPKTETVTISIVTMQGSELFSGKIYLKKGANVLAAKDFSFLPSGNYFIRIISSSKTVTQMITKLPRQQITI